MRNNKGLTILEVLISIAIVSGAIGVVVYLLVNVSNYSVAAESRSIAVAYAQEAVDIVKNIRDNNYCNFYSTAAPPNGYRNNRYYKIETVSGVYNLDEVSAANKWEYKYAAGSAEALSTGDSGLPGSIIPGGMRRSIRLEGISGGTDTNRRVEIVVEWKNRKGAGLDTYQIITEIYKWKY